MARGEALARRDTGVRSIRNERQSARSTPQPTSTEIDGQRLHVTHVRSPEPDALSLVYGWPFTDFGAMEAHDLLVADVRAFFRSVK